MLDALLAAMVRQRQVRRAVVALTVGLDWASVFRIIPRADVAGSVRIVDPDGPVAGYGKAEIAQRLGIDPAWTSDSWRALFDTGRYSLAVESFEQFHPEIEQIAERIRALTGCRVIATAFLSPPLHKGFAAHYDKADVLALQVHGKKRWRIYDPVDPDPNSRTPTIRLPPAEQLVAAGDHTLAPNDMLFVPSGWVHDVKNESDDASLHVSFVIFADSLMSIFGNAMTHAFSQMSSEHRWRATLGQAGALPRDAVQHMLAAFNEHVLAALTGDAEPFREHVRNGAALRAARAAARASLDTLAAGEHRHVVLQWVGGHYRSYLRGGVMEVSTDGKNTCGLDPLLYDLCKERGVVTLGDLQALSARTDEQVVHFANTAVRRLGLLEVLPPPAPRPPPAA